MKKEKLTICITHFIGDDPFYAIWLEFMGQYMSYCHQWKKASTAEKHANMIKDFHLQKGYDVEIIRVDKMDFHHQKEFVVIEILIQKHERLRKKYRDYKGNISWEVLEKEGFKFTDDEKIRLRRLARRDEMIVQTPFGITFLGKKKVERGLNSP